MTDENKNMWCPEHEIWLVGSPIPGLDFCPVPDCSWWYGWPTRGMKGSFVVEASIERSEEMRVDRLGPTQDDVQIESLPTGEERPTRTLGSF